MDRSGREHGREFQCLPLAAPGFLERWRGRFFEELTPRVNGNAVDSYLVMKVRVRALSGVSHIADLLILPDKLTFFYIDLR